MIKKNVVIKCLKEIHEKNGYLQPIAVVEYAKPISSPLHEAFEWNNNKAAAEYRLWQARELIAKVSVEFYGKETDAYWNATVQIGTEKVQAYFSTVQVLSNKELYKQVLQKALQELEYWQEKYQEIIELRKIINKKEMTRLKKEITK